MPVAGSLSKYSKKWSYSPDGAINGSKRWATETMADFSFRFVVKEQVVLRQMLVCYESILTGESRAFLFRYHLRERCDEKSQGSVVSAITMFRQLTILPYAAALDHHRASGCDGYH